MRYREHKPQVPLRRFVECFWTLEGTSISEPVQPDRILPDGCVELILNFGDRFKQHNGNEITVQPRYFLAGQMTRPILISPMGVADIIGIRFQPGGTVPFIHTPMHEITDQVVELGGPEPILERKLLRVCANLSNVANRLAAIEKLLLSYVLSFNQTSWLLSSAARVVESTGLISVDQLASDAGISARQLERRFLSEVGVSPKLLSRILRFQQVFQAVERCDGAWAPIALECGYYDQAHLIRDFNQFAQQTPAVLFAEQTGLTQSFTRKTRTSDFSNTTAS